MGLCLGDCIRLAAVEVLVVSLLKMLICGAIKPWKGLSAFGQ